MPRPVATVRPYQKPALVTLTSAHVFVIDHPSQGIKSMSYAALRAQLDATYADVLDQANAAVSTANEHKISALNSANTAASSAAAAAASATQAETQAQNAVERNSPINCTNAQRLAATGPVAGAVAGQLFRVTDQANRLEQYLGGRYSDNQNWLVLRNTVQLLIYSSENSAGPTTVNDILIPDGEAGFVGWVDPLNITTSAFGAVLEKTAISKGSITVTPNFPEGLFIRTDIFQIPSLNTGLDLGEGGKIWIPFQLPLRGAVILNGLTLLS
jgi:hypothetical protein